MSVGESLVGLVFEWGVEMAVWARDLPAGLLRAAAPGRSPPQSDVIVLEGSSIVSRSSKLLPSPGAFRRRLNAADARASACNLLFAGTIAIAT